MNEPAQLTSRRRLVTILGALLGAAGLLALFFPVFLDEYDRYGIQIKCGNGYYSQLLQASLDDEDAGRQLGAGASGAAGPAGGRVGLCRSALAVRRAWTMPLVGLGALILIPQAVAGAISRAAQRSAARTAGDWSERPDTYLHEAALLDRRDRSHWNRPSNTTL